MAGRQDLSWGDTPQGASCPPSTGPSHFCSLPSLFASASPCCSFSSPFLHSSVALLFKPTAPYHGQNKGEVKRWDFELEALGLTLLGLTEEMKVEEMGDFRPPRSLLKHTDPCRGFPCYCSGHGCSASSSHPGFQLTVPQSGQHCVPFSPQSGLSPSEFRATPGSLGRFPCPFALPSRWKAPGQSRLAGERVVNWTGPSWIRGMTSLPEDQ